MLNGLFMNGLAVLGTKVGKENDFNLPLCIYKMFLGPIDLRQRFNKKTFHDGYKKSPQVGGFL